MANSPFNVVGGGGLIANTVIDGLNAYNLSLVNLNTFTQNADILIINGTSISISADNVSINSLKYPNSDGNDGDILTTDGSGNLSFQHRPPAPVTSVNSKTGDVVLNTDDISEGSNNLYYQDARVSLNTDVSANTAARHSHSNKSILDNITDSGSGKIITDSERTKLSGIEDGAQVNTVNSVNSKTGDVVLNTDDISEGVNLYWTDARFDNRLATKTTDNLTEGSTNKYYKTSYFLTDLRNSSITELSDVDTTSITPVIGHVLKWDGSNWVPSVDAIGDSTSGGDMHKYTYDPNLIEADAFDYNNFINIPFIPQTTNDLPEGTNGLYYTNERVDARIALTNIEDLNNVDTVGVLSDQYLQYNGTNWVASTPPGAPVTSVFNRIGDVTAEYNDYQADLITYDNIGTNGTAGNWLISTNVKGAIDELAHMPAKYVSVDRTNNNYEGDNVQDVVDEIDDMLLQLYNYTFDTTVDTHNVASMPKICPKGTNVLTNIVSLADSNIIALNGDKANPIAFLDKGEVYQGYFNQNDTIESIKASFVSSDMFGQMVWNSYGNASKFFFITIHRSADPYKFYITNFAQHTNIEVKRDGVIVDTFEIEKNSTYEYLAYGTGEYLFKATNIVSIFGVGDNDTSDAVSLSPVATELLWWNSAIYMAPDDTARVSAYYPDTEIEYYFANGVHGTATIQPGQPFSLPNSVANYGVNGACYIKSKGIISATSSADGDGYNSTHWRSPDYTSYVFGLPSASQSASFVSLYPGKITIYERVASGTTGDTVLVEVGELTLTRSNITDETLPFPYAAKDNTSRSSGAIYTSNVPCNAMFDDADGDETVLFGTYSDVYGNVQSVFGRVGEVIGAYGDYTADQIIHDDTQNEFTSKNVQGALNETSVAIDELYNVALPVSFYYNSLARTMKICPTGTNVDTNIISLDDGNIIYKNKDYTQPLVSLNKGEIFNFTANANDIIESTEAAYVVSAAYGTMVWNSIGYSSKNFFVNIGRYANPFKFHISTFLVPSHVKVWKDGTLLDEFDITKESTIEFDVYGTGSYRFNSTNFISIFGVGDNNSTDAEVIAPVSTELLWWNSSLYDGVYATAAISALYPDTKVEYYFADGTYGSFIVQPGTPQPLPNSQTNYAPECACYITANGPIASTSSGDFDGANATSWVAPKYATYKFGLPEASQHASFVSRYPGKVYVYEPTAYGTSGDTKLELVTTLELSHYGTATVDLPFPYSAKDNISRPAGTIYETNVPCNAVFDESTGDETVLFGTTLDKNDVQNVFGRVGAIEAEYGDYSANLITFSGTNGLVSTDVQEALVELNTIKANSDLDGYLNSMSIEQQSLNLVVEGTHVYLDIEAVGGGDIHYWLDGEKITLNCTTNTGNNGNARIEIPQGTATNPLSSVVYVMFDEQLNKLDLSVSSTLPSGPVVTLAYVTIQSYNEVATDGALLLQRTTEAITHNQRGAISYEREKIRALGAQYWSGLDQNLIITTDSNSEDSIDFNVTNGIIYQLHRQTFPTYSISTNGIWVSNASGNATLTKYQKILDLNNIHETALGSTVNSGESINLVIWGSINYSTNDCKLFINLPTGKYTNDNDAINDVNNTAVTTIPFSFKTTGFLIAKLVLRYDDTDNGTWTNLLTEPVEVWNTSSADVSSPNYPNDYPNNSDVTETLTYSGASAVRVHFDFFDTEANYDFVYILDENDNTITSYNGTLSAFTSVEVQGDTIKLRFTSDNSVTRQGYHVDALEYKTYISSGRQIIDLRGINPGFNIVTLSTSISDVYAKNVIYDNSTSGLTSNNVQNAIDELNDNINNISTLNSTDDLPEGNSNLYYTDNRVSAVISNTSIDKLIDVDTTSLTPAVGSVLKWNGSNWVPGTDDTGDSTSGGDMFKYIYDPNNISSDAFDYNNFINTPSIPQTTNDLPEGTNGLYYTDERVDARIALTNIEDLNNVDTVGVLSDQYLQYNGTNWVASGLPESPVTSVFGRTGDIAAISGDYDAALITYNNTTSGLSATNTQDAIDELNSDIENIPIINSTDDLSEGSTNLYYTDARVSNNSDVSANTAARHTHSNKSTLDNITDAGSGKIITSAERTKLTNLDENAEQNVQSDWNETNTNSDAFILNKPTDLTDLSTHSVTELNDVTSAGSGQIITSTERTKLSGIEDGAQVNTVDSVNSETGTVVLDTDDISEGSTNLYYTDTRVSTVISTSSINLLSDVDTSTVSTGNVLKWDGSNWVPAEDNNSTSGVMFKNIYDPTEIEADAFDYNNFYNTPTIPQDTDDLPEGSTNLYYTDNRVSNNTDVAANTTARHTHSNKSILDSVTDAGSGKIITNSERTKLDGIEDGAEVNVNADWNASSGDAEILNKPTDLTDLSTHSVTELNDVTDAGSGKIITDSERTKLSGIEDGAQVNTVDSVNGETGTVVLDTDDISEGLNNLYYTNARVLTYINTLSIDELSDVDTTTVTPVVSDKLSWDGSNWVVTKIQNHYIELYQDSITTTIPRDGTLTAISWDGLTHVGSDFAFSSGDYEITIVNSGVYLVSYNLTLNGTTTTRTSTEAEVYINGNILDGSLSAGYHRNSSNGYGTISKSVIIPLSANDKIVVYVHVVNGRDAETVDNGCSLSILRL